MASSLRECDAYRPDSTIDPNCYCCYCIDRSQNLTTTFQSQSNSNVWQNQKCYNEEEVTIVLGDGMERVGFSIDAIKYDAIINSILS
ncbi:hypothetical protein LOAG_19114, partial [Loa loa]